MALGYLFLFFIFLLLMTITSILLLFLVKHRKMESVIIVVTALFGMWLSYLATTSLPTNFIGSRIITCFFGVLAGSGLILQYQRKILAAKIMIALSLILGLMELFFW